MNDMPFGDNPTLEEAHEATATLREGWKQRKGQYFDVKKGQALKVLYSYGIMKQGDIAVVLKDTPNHEVFLHQEQPYCKYNGHHRNFIPATEQEINAFYGVEAKIEESGTDNGRTGDNPAASVGENQESNQSPATEQESVLGAGNTDGPELDDGEIPEKHGSGG